MEQVAKSLGCQVAEQLGAGGGKLYWVRGENFTVTVQTEPRLVKVADALGADPQTISC